jgi:hypothetical protein
MIAARRSRAGAVAGTSPRPGRSVAHTLDRPRRRATRARSPPTRAPSRGRRSGPGSRAHPLQPTHVATTSPPLLVSPSFLASRVCMDLDVPPIMARSAAGRAHVVPILARDCGLSGTPFAGVHMRPLRGGPIASRADRDAAWREIAREVASLAGAVHARACWASMASAPAGSARVHAGGRAPPPSRRLGDCLDTRIRGHLARVGCAVAARDALLLLLDAVPLGAPHAGDVYRSVASEADQIRDALISRQEAVGIR